MTPEQRVEMEARVDRAVRRGDLSQARADLVTLLEAFPDDARLKSRLETFESAALPGELRPTRSAPEVRSESAAPERPEVLAERLVQQGDLPGALAAYRRAFEAHPENELFQERLSELFEQVRTEAAAAPAPVESAADAPSIDALLNATSPSAPESAPAAAASPKESDDPDPVARLEQLLERLRSRRRTA